MGCFESKPAINAAGNASTRSHRGERSDANGAAHAKSPLTREPSVRKLPDFGLGSLYSVVKELGAGGTGETWLCTEKETGADFAVKFIKRPIPSSMVPLVAHEIQIQQQLCRAHINIVTAKEAVLTRSHLAIVMEYVPGGTLTNHVSDRWSTTAERNGLFLSEDEARYFFKQFVRAVEFCHNHHIVHRDLKLDNTLLDSSKPPRIKLIDFGFAKNWEEDQNMHTHIGTPVYMSPQVINSRNLEEGYDGRKADIWALGVLVFVMLLGMFPFEHSENPDPNTSMAHAEVFLQQIKTTWRENPRIAEKALSLSVVSPMNLTDQMLARRKFEECRDLLDLLFNIDEAARPNIEQIKQHAWYQQPLPEELQAQLDALVTEQEALERAGSSVDLVQKVHGQNTPMQHVLKLTSKIQSALTPSNQAIKSRELWWTQVHGQNTRMQHVLKLVGQEGSSGEGIVRFNFWDQLTAAAEAAAAADTEPTSPPRNIVRASMQPAPDMTTIQEQDDEPTIPEQDETQPEVQPELRPDDVHLGLVAARA